MLDKKGLNFSLDNKVQYFDFIELGPLNESGLVAELNKFFNLKIEQIYKVDTYLFLHDSTWENISILKSGLPFVDPIIQKAAINSSLALETELEFNHFLFVMLRPGTSDAFGDVALDQALSRLKIKRAAGDAGFGFRQYFFKFSNYLEYQNNEDQFKVDFQKIANFLGNPELCLQISCSKKAYLAGVKVEIPVVSLSNKDINAEVEKIDILKFSDTDLLSLNKKRSLAASLEELKAFQSMYADDKFLIERKKLGLTSEATDVEIETWFGLRSEHCFHKEFAAEIKIEVEDDLETFEKALLEGIFIDNTHSDSEANSSSKKNNLLLKNGIFKTFIKDPADEIFNKLEKRGKNWIASMFSDNAGVVYYDENYMFCIKAETHNSPSNKEPVQGAKTGLNGNFRDIMGTMRGTFDILSGGFLYCTGNPNSNTWLPKDVKHPYVILKGITQGVREAGNEMQVPTLWGGVIIDPRFVAKCLVFCSAVGWSPVRSEDLKIDYTSKEPNINDLVFIVGQAVGIDGIHGATESSLSASSSISLGHVQADFSFIQAKVKEFMLEASREGLFTAVTDCGAMGLGSSSHEIARDTGGLEMDLAKHPVKYAGIKPWQINCSETQDRMLLIVSPKNRSKVLALAAKHQVVASELGTLTNSGFIHLKYNHESVGLIDINKLFNKEPKKKMLAKWSKKLLGADYDLNEAEVIKKINFQELVEALVAEPDLSSKEWFFRQKDFSVKGGTLLPPLVGNELNISSDVSIQKPLDTVGKDFGALAYTWSAACKNTDLDPYVSAQNAFVEAVGKLVAAGATLPNFEIPKWDTWAVCGNYCQPNSDSETALMEEVAKFNLASLVREGMGVKDAVTALGIPVISGKDSMKCSCVYSVPEDFDFDKYNVDADLRRNILHDKLNNKIEIHDPETYLVTASAKIQDYRKAQDFSFKKSGDILCLVGLFGSGLGGSQVLSAAGKITVGRPFTGKNMPAVNFVEFISACRFIENAIEQEVLASSSYVASGGIFYNVFKSAYSANLGINITLSPEQFLDNSENNLSWQEFLFSESPGRFLLTVSPADYEKLIKIAEKQSIPVFKIGEVVEEENIKIKIGAMEENTLIGNLVSKYKENFNFFKQN